MSHHPNVRMVSETRETRETREPLTLDTSDAPWSVYVLVWRPLRSRWLVTQSRIGHMGWTREELAVEPRLGFSFRPYALVVGPLWFVMDAAVDMRPRLDLPQDSVFWAGDLGVE